MREQTNYLKLFEGQASTRIRIIEPGALLFAKGEAATDMFIVRLGELQIFDGNFVFENVRPGELVGEMAIVDGSPRSASVRALERTEVFAMDREQFLSIIEEVPLFAIRVMQTLSTRIRNVNELAKSLA
jgi:CRP/FNR family transcriptional regulator